MRHRLIIAVTAATTWILTASAFAQGTPAPAGTSPQNAPSESSQPQSPGGQPTMMMPGMSDQGEGMMGDTEHGEARGGMRRGERWAAGRMGMMHGMMQMMAGKGPFFAFRSGQNGFMVRCAENEPMKACVDAIMPLLDKLHGLTPAGK